MEKKYLTIGTYIELTYLYWRTTYEVVKGVCARPQHRAFATARCQSQTPRSRTSGVPTRPPPPCRRTF
eukprot:1633286-Pleurochrysis_carterae.AAC.8